MNIKVRTNVAGRDYSARVLHDNDRLIGSYRLMLTDDGMVQIFTPEYTLGLYNLDRFRDMLCPNSVRQFFLTSFAVSPIGA